MNKKITMSIGIILILCSISVQSVSAETVPGQIYEGEDNFIFRNVTVYAPAVASTDEGYIGVISTITVTIQSNGNGRVFVDTLPLTQIDMQGSARLAVKVASALVENDENCDVKPSEFDYFFVVRTDAPIIGGPSAGATMTVATIALLENWTINENTIMTGMINPDSSIGPIGGIPQKIDAAWSVGAKRFLIPKGQGTYTEMVSSQNGWLITTRPVVKTVDEYVQEKGYDIDVVEVGDVSQAVENFTGYNFDFEEGTGEITTENYLTSMKPLAESLLYNASEYYKYAGEKLDNSSLPNTGGIFNFDNYRDYVEEKLVNARSTLDESGNWFNQSQYYTSTSKSFQSLIYSRFIVYACEYYEEIQKDETQYIEDLIKNVESLYENVSKIAKNEEIKGYITLQSIGAAQRRVSEAKGILDEVKSDYEGGEVQTFWKVLYMLEDIAFVQERCNSVEWWVDIGTKFTEVGNLTNSSIENIALEYIEEAQQSILYSTIIIDEIYGYDTSDQTYVTAQSFLNDASSLLETARDNLEISYPAAAFFESLEALVKANLAIEIIGIDAQEKLNLSSESASSNIAKCRKKSIEPILAVSYYEYADSLRNESSYSSALLYYKLSGMIAGALGFTNVSTGSTSSRYVGLPAFKSSIRQNDVFSLLSMFILGALAGVGLGLILSGLFNKEPKKPARKNKKTTELKNIYSYQKTNYQYPDKQLPRSIRDFYKKNK